MTLCDTERAVRKTLLVNSWSSIILMKNFLEVTFLQKNENINQSLHLNLFLQMNHKEDTLNSSYVIHI